MTKWQVETTWTGPQVVYWKFLLDMSLKIFLVWGQSTFWKQLLWKGNEVARPLLHLKSYSIYRNGKMSFFIPRNYTYQKLFYFSSSFRPLYDWNGPKSIKEKILIFNVIVLANQGAGGENRIYHCYKKNQSSNSLRCFSYLFPFVPICHYLLTSKGSAGIYLLMRLLYFGPRDWNKPLFTNKYHLFSFGLLGSY